jgi:hypothetical protein
LLFKIEVILTLQEKKKTEKELASCNDTRIKEGQPWVIIHFGIREKVIENKF